MNSRRLLSLAVAVSAVVGLTACASPDDRAAEFATWAASEKFVASVDARPGSGGGISAHLVVDGAIGADELESLTKAALAEVRTLGVSSAGINIIVGNAWGFSADTAGTNVGIVNELRDEPAFVGATVEYQPLEPGPDDTDGVRGIVGSQAALRGANDALITAVRDNGGDIDGLPIGASTADGAFSISGEGDAQPAAAIQLWQAISGRVVLTGAQATLDPSHPERLEATVGSADEQATAEAIGSQFPDVELTVDLATP